jgi:hypothetical protein
LRFRVAEGEWDDHRVRSELLGPLDGKFGTTLTEPRIDPPPDYEARALEMDNGDLALFAWTDDRAFWLGNTETPESLWRTDKVSFGRAPYPLARWAQRELLDRLAETDPWLADHRHVAWFFLPVFFSKDGRETTRAFFRDHAAGFPDATREEGLAFLDDLLRTTPLDDHRYTMAAKLGTSEGMDVTRMSATIGEFTVAKLLADAGYAFVPEVELDSGHALDFRVTADRGDVLVEVTRPVPPARRRTNDPAAAIRATAGAKTDGQLAAHGDAVLFVDCSSFRDDEWPAIRNGRPAVGHEPAVVFRARPDGSVEGYAAGTLPLDLGGAIDWVR